MISLFLVLIAAYVFYRQRNGVAVFLLLSCLFWSLLLFNLLALDPFISALSAALLSVMPLFFVDRLSLSEIVLGYCDQLASLGRGK